jgi:DNA polymerase I
MIHYQKPQSAAPWTPEETAEWLALRATLSTGPQSGKGRRVVFDNEGNGILRAEGSMTACDTLWCIGAKDLDTKEYFYWGVDLGPDSIEHGLRFLAEVDLALAHNGIGYDYQIQEELYPWWKRPAKAWDTLVLAKIIWPAETLIERDLKRIQSGRMPPKYLKSHSLAAWGYRTGTHKVEYSGGFEAWRPAMATYMMTGDLDGPEALWALMERKLGWAKDTPPGAFVWPERTIEVEMGVARIIMDQELDGIRFDREAAMELSRTLLNDQRSIERRLVDTFGSWWQPLDDPDEGTSAARTTQSEFNPFGHTVTIRRVSEKTGKELKPYVGPPLLECVKGDPFVRIERTTYNPTSRDHLGQRLQDVFGWKPKKFGKARDGVPGKPTVDEGTLEEIPESVLPAETRQLILDYFVVTKTLGMLSKGAQAWLALVNRHGLKHGTTDRIHGRMDTVGAVTRRGTHSGPNLGQVPSVKKEKVTEEVCRCGGTKSTHGWPCTHGGCSFETITKEVPLLGLAGRYGVECRSLFTADEGWEQTGVDASSLELIDLGHYLHPFDEGKFSERVCDPKRDPHQEHADIADMTRGDAKTTIYLKVYGGSAYKLSLSLSVEKSEIPQLLTYRGMSGLLKGLERRFDEAFVKKIAKAQVIIKKLEAGIEGLKLLIDRVQQAAKERGWLKAIDGSKIHVRKAHAALNSLLQSAGAISCKLWIFLLHQELARLGLKRGVDFKQVLWVHDELQFTHRPGLGPIIKDAAERMMVKAGEELGLRGRYRTDGKTGKNWMECH